MNRALSNALSAKEGASIAELAHPDDREEVVRMRAQFAILDLTGVDAMDTGTAAHILRLIAALRLLGAEGVITGIRPGIAHTMAGLGVAMDTVRTLASLRDGLRYCMEAMR